MPLQLGKNAVKKDPRNLQFSKYAQPVALPAPPAVFGHATLVSNFGMLGNDQYGDCVWAGAAHETMLWNMENNKRVPFTEKSVLSDYAAVTGFNPHTGAGDDGTSVLDALNYRVKTGVVDAAGTRHKLGAFVQLKKGNLTQLRQAAYLFGAVAIGIRFPSSAMAQFNADKPWDVVKGAKIEGGHYVPVVGQDGNLQIITWGKAQQMTPAFYAKYCDESYALLSTEMLVAGKTLEGFDLATLQADLAAIKHG